MSKLYIAYGSNINLEHMAYTCPTAKIKGVGEVRGWNLVFRGIDDSVYATIEPKDNRVVPVLIWEIEAPDEKALDEYEEYPELYRKKIIHAIYKGEVLEAMVYIMNEGMPIEKPSQSYFETIKKGYEAVGIDVKILEKFLENQGIR
ncbi:MAG: gamma-glutamylcyclotransferase family protein [Bacillota bacterium]|nr:gamma-glutamylcyclotransferase family protein [Bacillota bacterium]